MTRMSLDDGRRPRLETHDEGRILPPWIACKPVKQVSLVFEEMSQQARQDGDKTRNEQCRTVAATLFAGGLGIDAACPR
jgi:hypothetical protein